MILRPFSSTRVSRASGAPSALATAASTSSWVWLDSNTSSRGECSTPILTSTAACPSRCDCCPINQSLAGPAGAQPRGRSAVSERVVGLVLPREGRDATPGQRLEQPYRALLGHRPFALQPIPGADLRYGGERDRQQLRLGPLQPGVGDDRVGDGLHA